jgi:hypothetical protein
VTAPKALLSETLDLDRAVTKQPQIGDFDMAYGEAEIPTRDKKSAVYVRRKRNPMLDFLAIRPFVGLSDSMLADFAPRKLLTVNRILL